MEMVNLFELLHVACARHNNSLTSVITGLLAPLYIPLVGFIYSGEWTRDAWDGPEEGCDPVTEIQLCLSAESIGFASKVRNQCGSGSVVFRGTVNQVLQRAPSADLEADARTVSKPINKGICKSLQEVSHQRQIIWQQRSRTSFVVISLDYRLARSHYTVMFPVGNRLRPRSCRWFRRAEY